MPIGWGREAWGDSPWGGSVNYMASLTSLTRGAQIIVDVYLDFCDNTYGVAPCTAAGSVECYNTRFTCQDPANYANTTGKIYQFSLKNKPLPIPGSQIRPYLLDISYIPTKIDPEKSLTESARVTLKFADEIDNDIGVDPYVGNRTTVQGTFWKKLLARNIYYLGRKVVIKEGFDGLAEAEYQKREYIIEQIKGPNNGIMQIICKDRLKLADRVQIPKATDGALTAELTSAATAIPCDSPAQYAGGNLVRIDDELITFSTYDSTALLLGTTGVRGHSVGLIQTDATTHSTGTKIQLCYSATNKNVWDIMSSVLINNVGFDATQIDAAGATAERDQWLNSFTFTGLISQPMDADKVLLELKEQSNSNLWWSDEEQLVKFKVFAPPSPTEVVNHWTDTANFINSERDNNEDSRISRVVINFGKNRLDDDDKPEAYAQNTIRASTEAESADEHGQQAIKTIFSRWTTSESVMNAVGDRIINRFKNPAAILTNELELKDSTVQTGNIVSMTSTMYVGITGAAESSRTFQVLSKERKSLGSFEYILMDTQMGHRSGFIAPAGYPDYSSATSDQRTYAFIGDTDNLLTDENGGKVEGYYIY